MGHCKFTFSHIHRSNGSKWRCMGKFVLLHIFCNVFLWRSDRTGFNFKTKSEQKLNRNFQPAHPFVIVCEHSRVPSVFYFLSMKSYDHNVSVQVMSCNRLYSGRLPGQIEGSISYCDTDSASVYRLLNCHHLRQDNVLCMHSDGGWMCKFRDINILRLMWSLIIIFNL